MEHLCVHPRVDNGLGQSDALGVVSKTMDLAEAWGFADDSNASLGLGVAAVRNGFGRTEALAGIRMGLQF